MNELIQILKDSGVIDNLIKAHIESRDAVRSRHGDSQWNPTFDALKFGTAIGFEFELMKNGEVREKMQKYNKDAVVEEIVKIIMEVE